MNIPAKNRYRMIARRGRSGGTWSQMISTVFPAGTVDFFATADEVELLIDRRGFINGDANLDDRVDLADFNALAAHFGQAVNGWAFGDFTLDGAVNLLDFNLLAANFGLTSGDVSLAPADWAALASAVPEPSVVVLLILPLFVRRRKR